jgi:tetratricopeptide (TPR) repeat protein
MCLVVYMIKTQRNDNFVDKTFIVIADILLKLFPASKQEKQAFFYYKDGMSAQSDGEYAEALEDYYEALQIEEDAYDRSFILYNIGLIYSSNGEYVKALEYYHEAIEFNSNLMQALNNIAVIYHYQGTKAFEKQNAEVARLLFDKAAEYWKQAINLSPNNYIEATNWLKTTSRVSPENFY